MNRDQVIEAFELGDIGNVEFFELALDAGLSLEKIELILKAHIEAQEFAED